MPSISMIQARVENKAAETETSSQYESGNVMSGENTLYKAKKGVKIDILLSINTGRIGG